MNRFLKSISLSILLLGMINTSVYAEESNINEINKIEDSIEFSKSEDILTQVKQYISKEFKDINVEEVTIKYTPITDEELQNITIEVYKNKDDLLPTYKKTIMVKFVQDKPTLKLKKNEVTVNNGDTFNPSSYISFIGAENNLLPALEVKSNVNTSVDGDYNVTYKVTDLKGNVAEKTLKVTVKTHQEVLEKQEQERVEAEQAEQERLEQERLGNERLSQITNQRNLVQSYSNTVTYTGNSAVDRALSYVGYSYIWGSNNPANGGFDCSGLVQYCYGLSARTTYEQRNLGTHHYDVWNAPAGALYFYNGDSHVSIATGNGGTVQAMNESVGVTTQNIGSWMPDYYVIPGQ